MAVARYILKTLDGIDRPAIATVMPHRADGYTTYWTRRQRRLQRRTPAAVRGAGQRAGGGGGKKEEPSCLLKSAKRPSRAARPSSARRVAARGGASGQINFHGNVEGNDIFKGTTDIVVCDGFVGNVLLKSAEVGDDATDFIRQSSRARPTRAGGVVALPVLKHFKTGRPRCHGAALLGLRGLVLYHGSADAFAFEQALVRL